MAELAATTEQILQHLATTHRRRGEARARHRHQREGARQGVTDTPVLVIRDHQPGDAMSTMSPAAYGELESYLRELGVEPAGAPITLCPYADDDGMVAVENSFPVAEGVPGRGRIEAVVLPRARCCRSSTGATTTSSTARPVLQVAVERAGLEASGGPRELYWTGPEDVPVEKWLTEFQFPVVRDDAKLAAVA